MNFTLSMPQELQEEGKVHNTRIFEEYQFNQ